jgi:hypothetical protein
VTEYDGDTRKDSENPFADEPDIPVAAVDGRLCNRASIADAGGSECAASAELFASLDGGTDSGGN